MTQTPTNHAIKQAAQREIIIGLAAFVLALALWLYIIPTWIEGGEADAYFSTVISQAMAFLALALTLQATRNWLRVRHLDGSDREDSTEKTAIFYRFLGLLAVWCANVYFMDTIGFYITSPIAIALTMMLVQVKSLRTIALWTILPFPVIYLLFEIALNVRLPRGLF